jgi:hypothetical protein
MRSQIGDAARAAYKNGNSEYGAALNDLRDALDDGMQSQLSQDEQESLAQARQKYANLVAISDATKPTGDAAISETINPKNLAATLSSQNKRLYSQGYGDLNDLAQGGVKILGSSIVPSHPALQGLGKAGEGGAGALLGHLLAGPEGAALGAAAGVTVPYAGKAIYNNPKVQNYLINGIPIKGLTPQELGTMLNNVGQVAGRGITAATPMQNFTQ